MKKIEKQEKQLDTHSNHKHVHEDGHTCHGTANPYVEECERVFTLQGMRRTETRTIVLNALASAKEPLSPKMMHEQFQKKTEKNQKVPDLVSIYRILETLRDLGLVHQIHPSGEFVKCDHLYCDENSHLIMHCGKCNAVDEIHLPESMIGNLKSFLERQKRFKPLHLQIQFDGLCAKCR